MPMILYQAPTLLGRRGGSSPPARDGFADFYGYEEAAAGRPQPGGAAKARAPGDGFAEFYGYAGEEEGLSEEDFDAVFLPDRDPGSPRSDKRRLISATEAGLAEVRAAVEERRAALPLAEGADADRLVEEIYSLRLQQSRLVKAIWSLQEEHGATPRAPPPSR